ncbi:MAG: hypothetical protein ACI802_002154 [Candidatus Paceibacteria bacterium]|jgi:hypothetical protein
MFLINRLYRPVLRRIKKAHVQSRVRGFALAELAIAVVIAGMMIVSGMTYYKRQLQDDTAYALAEQYKTVNNAVGTYMMNHWPILVDMPQECGITTWRVGAGTPITANCTRNLVPSGSGVLSVVNALQPTIADLVNLGYLQQGQAGPLLRPDTTVVQQANGTAAPHTFGILIEVVCTNTAVPTTNLTQCPDASQRRDLRSVVFNVRPYANVDNQLYNILGEALSALPNDAGMSVSFGTTNLALDLVGRAKPGAVDAIVDNNFVKISNPVRSGTTGLAGILGVRGGYGSSGFQVFTRRDGSAPPLGNWDFNNKNLNNVQYFDAKEITGGTIDAGEKFRLPQKPPNVGLCDPNSESIAFMTDTKAVVVCDKDGKWQLLKAKGVDIAEAMSVSISLPKTNDGEYGEIELKNGRGEKICGKDWGMPSLIAIDQGGVNFEDNFCPRVDADKKLERLGNLNPLDNYDYYPCRQDAIETKEVNVAQNLKFYLFQIGDSNSCWRLNYYTPHTNHAISYRFYKVNSHLSN